MDFPHIKGGLNLKNRKLLACLLILVMALVFSACGKAEKSDYGNNFLEEDSTVEEVVTDSENASGSLPDNRKLIQTAEIWVETEDLDALISNIEKRTSSLGGYIENSEIENGSAYGGARYRSANIKIRVPEKSFNSFIDNVGEISNVVSSQKNVDDVTLDYVATESRMKALQAEEERLLSFMAQAETMEDLLTVEERLTEVRSELETVTSTLRVLENQIDFSTITLNIDEVKEYTDVTEPESIWQRMGDGFVDSLKNVGNFFKELFVFVVVASPYLITLAIIPLILVVAALIVVRIVRRKKAKKDVEGKKE